MRAVRYSSSVSHLELVVAGDVVWLPELLLATTTSLLTSLPYLRLAS